ncbi:cytochrome c biogenesis CcdA family protein [Evansella cellulosilytica]|uniref:Cytochrome c biogenesis protein transmembrane region n=1 Tax=Evansella cellulosilytica (strain ATCC 21833 / DSM 2522 / FERM P-1141 / JCM 9156 / N-4) TaxID=649639 RepID=E6TV56_EVAC2|nr:cytochrome c biogenesis CcdA family protein [Evansella cellulosilytica]ADU29740.1 cytochrome c biogenesis protein transmembrane region [Evansella cellulosilytica DSM 2522]
MTVLSVFNISEFTFLSIWIALFAGIVSFLSPCVFPLVPAYIAQLTGSNISNNEVIADRKLILTRSIGFIIGFSSIFLVLGFYSSYLGSLFIENSQLLERLGGIVIVLFGLQLMGIFSFNFLMSEKRLMRPSKTTSFGRSILFGLVFAAGWSPCIGLVLGSILALASQSGGAFGGVILLLVYSLGLGIPFLIVAMLYSKSLEKIRNINRYLPIIQKASGVIMILLGVMLFTGLFSRLAAYLARFIPFYL